MREQVISSEERQKAISQLKENPGDQSTTIPGEDIRLYVAMKPLKGPGGRIGGKEFARWKSTVMTFCEVQPTYWILAKQRRPALRQEFGDKAKRFWVDPKTLVQWPSDLDPEKYWVLDGGYPQFDLGPGCQALKSGARKEWKAKEAQPALPPIAGPVDVVEPNGPTGLDPPRPDVTTTAPQRCLTRTDSDTEEQHAEHIAKATKGALLNNVISAKDKCNPPPLRRVSSGGSVRKCSEPQEGEAWRAPRVVLGEPWSSPSSTFGLWCRNS